MNHCVKYIKKNGEIGDMSIDFNTLGHPKFRSSMMPEPSGRTGPNLNSTEQLLDYSHSRSADGLRTPDLSVLNEPKSDPNEIVELYKQVQYMMVLL